MKLKILIVILFFPSNLLFALDENSNKEDYLYKIYQKYNSQPTSQDIWEKALSKRSGQEYKISKGDTLWDVSKTLFGDGFFWSKVWSLNPFITNPHQITVGQSIHFYPGMGLESPGLKVNQLSSTQLILSTTPLEKTKWWKSEDLPLIPVDLAGITLPSPMKSYTNVLNDFPDSLPNWFFQTDSGIDKAPLEIIPLKLEKIENILSLPFFISEYPQEIKGKIFEIEKNAKAASERDYLFIDSYENLEIGSIYTVINGMGKINDPEAIDDFPKSYEIQGEIKIIGKIEGYYKAIVVSALFPVQIGAQIIPGPSPKMNLTEPGEYAKIQGMIIGGENDTTRSLFGPQSIIYINRGTADGIKINQRAPIMAVHRLRHPDSSIYSNTWKLGEIKIVQVEKNYSTAVIMTATDGIVPGDIVGELNPNDITENFKQLDSSFEFGDNDDDGAVKFEKLNPLEKNKKESKDNFDDFSSETDVNEQENEINEQKKE